MASRVYVFCVCMGLVAQVAFAQRQDAPRVELQKVDLKDRGTMPDNDDRHADESRPYHCHAEKLPTLLAFDNLPAAIEQHEVHFVETGHAGASFRFRNLQPTSIEAVALIMEYLDDEGHPIDEMPVAGGSKTAARRFHAPFPVEPAWVYQKGVQQEEHWQSAVPPGGSVVLAGSKDGIRTGHCPVVARVKFLRLQLIDGSVRTYSSPNWYLGPIPRRVPEVPTTFRPLPALNRPLSLLATVKISVSGKVVDVVPDDSNDQPQVLRWLADFMKEEWDFHPALVGGKPVDSKLTMLFRFPADATSAFPETDRMLSPVTLVQFFRKHDLHPNNYTGSDLVVLYGQAEEGSVVE